MTKDDIIEQLIDDDIQTILSSGTSADYLSNILRHGVGYANQSDIEILKEFNSRTWEN